MLNFCCNQCGSLEFEFVETELRLTLPKSRQKYYEIRQEEPCCIHCTWVPSEGLSGVTVLRKIPRSRPVGGYFVSLQ